MSIRLRISFIILGILCIATLAYRIWAGWGLITIDANDRPVVEVVRSVEKQAGIRLRSTLPAETKVTLHLKKVPLLHALEVLAANTEANWTVAYFPVR